MADNDRARTDRRARRTRDTGSRGLPRPRSTERRARLGDRAKAAPGRAARQFIALPRRVNPLAAVVVFLVVAFLALSVATPLRNYFQQRAELQHINEQITDQLQRRDELRSELDRYRNEDYVREQARTRLGLIEPGESSFRLLDPRISSGGTDADGQAPGEAELPSEKNKPWYTRLWDSVAVPAEAGGDAPPGDGSHGPGHVLPVPTVPQPGEDDGTAAESDPGGQDTPARDTPRRGADTQTADRRPDDARQ
ncbi:FtsB family cell division protein [Corynebacterium bovis]|uniref:Cell division protein FtsB n=1 Tax=Corynebacterium bovis DSM 20582 = CIP 54.80 TaxID=927655 RepID=A0A8H9Y8Q5_9CORY|nr:septum formation initiator family protein [Corynebacterium bovis]MBB3115790.1 cell division protein FtsB [Corynebacterium bovis DSM 20582 = CIP 54.80]MBB3116884.1 cell division protein FtsB [Corynebacterium bovis DSM 20582 = CIP 54.80]QQC47460.1 septum formation initiator family protein [Corynebacterium bovis]RRO81945.1 septum formation initiator family protein [Corynebacterium bovis]RRO84048.1 septum formation initiator family protein [Corynebacterium bovis]